MTKIDCDLKNCVYNKEGICQKGEILLIQHDGCMSGDE